MQVYWLLMYKLSTLKLIYYPESVVFCYLEFYNASANYPYVDLVETKNS